MNVAQLREHVVIRALRHLEPVIPYSDVAVELVLGTAAVESHFEHLQQIQGPALGLWQIEPATHDDLWRNYILHRPPLRERMLALCGLWPTRADQLRTNLLYGAAMCRVHYRRSPVPLPSTVTDVRGLAWVWKRAYNTSAGKGTIDQFISAYNRMVRP